MDHHKRNLGDRSDISNGPRGHYYDTVAKNVSDFFCSKDFPEAKFKSNALISLAEVITRSPIMWFLVITLVQV